MEMALRWVAKPAITEKGSQTSLGVLDHVVTYGYSRYSLDPPYFPWPKPLLVCLRSRLQYVPPLPSLSYTRPRHLQF